jgi:hypothetical protein
MTGLAGIAGGEVIAGLAAYGNKAVVMTAHATGRQALVKKRSGEAFGCNRGDDKLNGSLTGDAASLYCRLVWKPGTSDNSTAAIMSYTNCCR